MPGIYPVGAEAVREDSGDFDSAIIADSAGRRWRVRAPRRPDASMRLEAEHLILQSFSPGLRARLPFAVPSIMAGVNQSLMMAFGMVVIAGIVGSGGLGETIYGAIRTLDIATSINASIAIVVLTMVLDRVTQSLARAK